MIRVNVWVLHFSPLNMKMLRILVMSSQLQSSCTSFKIMKRMEHIQVTVFFFFAESIYGYLIYCVTGSLLDPC